MWHISYNPEEYIDFRGVITLAVDVWSWKLCQIKDPLVFGAGNRESVNKTSCCVESSDHRTCWRVVLMTLRSTMF